MTFTNQKALKLAAGAKVSIKGKLPLVGEASEDDTFNIEHTSTDISVATTTMTSVESIALPVTVKPMHRKKVEVTQARCRVERDYRCTQVVWVDGKEYRKRIEGTFTGLGGMNSQAVVHEDEPLRTR